MPADSSSYLPCSSSSWYASWWQDGGGNDALSHEADCQAFNDRCKQVIDEVRP